MQVTMKSDQKSEAFEALPSTCCHTQVSTIYLLYAYLALTVANSGEVEQNVVDDQLYHVYRLFNCTICSIP